MRDTNELLLGLGLLLIGACHATYHIYHRHMISLTHVAAWFICLFMGTAPIIAYLKLGSLPWAPTYGLMVAYTAVYFYVFGVLFIGAVMPKGYSAAFPGRSAFASIVERSKLIDVRVVGSMFLLSFFFSLYYGLTYGFLFSGDAGTRGMEVPYWVSSTYLFLKSFPDACVIWATVALFAKPPRHRLLAILVMIGTFLLAFLAGRRFMTFKLILIALCFTIAVGWRLRFVVFSAIVAFFILQFAMPFFWAVRQHRVSHNKGDIGASLLIDIMSAATDWNSDTMKLAYDKNFGLRSLTIRSTAEIAQAESESTPLYGQAFAQCFITATPYILLPEKRTAEDPRQVVVRHFALKDVDTPGGWYVMGLADFGLIGAFLAGIAMGAILRSIELFANKLSEYLPTVALMGAGVAFGALAVIDEPPSGLVVKVRDYTVVVILSSALLPFVKRKSEPDQGIGPAVAVPGGETLQFYDPWMIR